MCVGYDCQVRIMWYYCVCTPCKASVVEQSTAWTCWSTGSLLIRTLSRYHAASLPAFLASWLLVISADLLDGFSCLLYVHPLGLFGRPYPSHDHPTSKPQTSFTVSLSSLLSVWLQWQERQQCCQSQPIQQAHTNEPPLWPFLTPYLYMWSVRALSFHHYFLICRRRQVVAVKPWFPANIGILGPTVSDAV